tara:strand:- start:2574 stop:3071 length:498 start_codon:yes stop_codon:yes gene_type:complete
MWFFMILCYVLVTISGLGLVQIGLNHYFDFWQTHRITFDLIVSIIFIAAQTLVMFFFVGTGVNIREYLEEHPELGHDLYKKMFAIKRRLYPPTMMVTMLFMVTVIVDGIYYFGRISEWWFHASYFLTLWYFYKATKEQHASFKGSTEIVLEMTKKERDAVNTNPS